MQIGTYTGILVIALPFIALSLAGYWTLFQKAGEKGWKALIPFYSAYIMLKISGRPGWWVIWLFVPLISWIFSVGILVDFIKCFGKCHLRERVAAVLLPFIYLPKWGFENKTHYLGRSATPEFRIKYPYSMRPATALQWGQALFFSVFAAVFTRAFFAESYVIPTPSMERTLLTGDYVLVSKVNYGPRVPITPLAYPFANHTLPYGGLKSYWDIIQLPYLRLPGFSGVKLNDVVVFNFPEDTLENRPVDKKEIYIKRCTGLPGDTLKIASGDVYVNGKKLPEPADEELSYKVQLKNEEMNPEVWADLHITRSTVDSGSLFMTRASAAALAKTPGVIKVQQQLSLNEKAVDGASIFPFETQSTEEPAGHPLTLNWSIDNMGPIIIPKKGWAVKLDSNNFALYERAIAVYEHNKVDMKDGKMYINGRQANTYTFKMNYYWVMGDNRYDSMDSRFWGFVPEDHIIGRAMFTWMSWDSDAPLFEKIRWNRLLKLVR